MATQSACTSKAHIRAHVANMEHRLWSPHTHSTTCTHMQQRMKREAGKGERKRSSCRRQCSQSMEQEAGKGRGEVKEGRPSPSAQTAKAAQVTPPRSPCGRQRSQSVEQEAAKRRREVKKPRPSPSARAATAAQVTPPRSPCRRQHSQSTTACMHTLDFRRLPALRSNTLIIE